MTVGSVPTSSIALSLGSPEPGLYQRALCLPATWPITDCMCRPDHLALGVAAGRSGQYISMLWPRAAGCPDVSLVVIGNVVHLQIYYLSELPAWPHPTHWKTWSEIWVAVSYVSI